MLSREEAIKKHRDMWNWIADRIKESKSMQCIYGLKEKYTHQHNEDVAYDCYLCQYCIDKVGEEDRKIRCRECPLDWESKGDEYSLYQCLKNGKFEGYYRYATSTLSWEEQYLFCCKIANLKEREVEGEENGISKEM